MASFLDGTSWGFVLNAGMIVIAGWMLTSALFRLKQGEAILIGLGVGIVLNTWLLNLLAQVVDLHLAVWISPAVLLVLGLLSQRPWIRRKITGIQIPVGYLLVFVLVTFVFYRIGRGLGIFDDYLNMPVASIMATGEIPPHFPSNPAMRYDYHYLLLLMSAQFMRVGGMYVWSAMDLARAISVGLTVVLGSMLAWRITHSRLAAFLSGIFVLFDGGARWLLLLLPSSIIDKISSDIHMIGSSQATAPDLATALGTPWATYGAGPIPFPFAFLSGINRPIIMAHGAIGAMPFAITLLVMLLYRRGKDWRSWALVTALVAALALIDESLFILILGGAVLAWLVYVMKNHTLRIPKSLIPWVYTIGAAGLIVLFQGGMLTDWVFTHLFSRDQDQASFYSARMIASWPPAFVSVHLGVLSLFRPYQLLLAILELGPSILLYPLIVIYGLKKIRSDSWFDAALVGAGLVSLVFLFIAYDGTGGIAGSARLFNGLTISCRLMAVPLLWVISRKRTDGFRLFATAFGTVCVVSGIILFGVQLPAAQKPVYTEFLNELDAQMAAKYWNRLEPEAWIFDPVPERATSIFGRYTNSDVANFVHFPEWEALLIAPDPYQLRAAGYSYIYFDKRYWDHLDLQYSQLLRSSCVHVVEQIKGEREPGSGIADFRRLLDLRDCK